MFDKAKFRSRFKIGTPSTEDGWLDDFLSFAKSYILKKGVVVYSDSTIATVHKPKIFNSRQNIFNINWVKKENINWIKVLSRDNQSYEKILEELKDYEVEGYHYEATDTAIRLNIYNQTFCYPYYLAIEAIWGFSALPKDIEFAFIVAFGTWLKKVKLLNQSLEKDGQSIKSKKIGDISISYESANQELESMYNFEVFFDENSGIQKILNAYV